MNFFINWFLLLVLNQILFYNSCFQLYCIKNALFYTGVITFILTLFIGIYEKYQISKLFIESAPDINSKKSSSCIETEVLKTSNDKAISEDNNFFSEKEKIDTTEICISETRDRNKIIYDSNILYKPLYKNIPMFLDSKGINSFYHFTDIRNLESIIENRGLYSWFSIQKKNINSFMSSDELSRQIDFRKNLESYVRLSFVKKHPMKYIVEKKRGKKLILLEIDVSVACWESTLFSDMNATDNSVTIGNDLEFLKGLNYDIFEQRYVKLDDIKKKKYQAEIMVKDFLPIKYIKNIDILYKKYLSNY